MIHNLCPRYLSMLVPPYVHEISRFPLRNANDLFRPKIRKGYFLYSFLWSSVDDWNRLDTRYRHLPSLKLFKSELKNLLFYTGNPLFDIGVGKGAICHARLRMGLSGLNAHRRKYNFITHNECPKCGGKPEDEVHFFTKCPNYAIQRAVLVGTITPLITISATPLSRAESVILTSILLNGSP